MSRGIPVPNVYRYSSAEGDVHLPYILMSKVEGVQVSSVWGDVDDDKRRIILRQVFDILLELWSHRFDKDGVLCKRADGENGKDGILNLPQLSKTAPGTRTLANALHTPMVPITG